MALSVGDRLGPYEILAPIGKGGMGEVYRAYDSRLNRHVAIKLSKAQFTERFTREARAIAALNHTNICHVYDVGPDYLVLEHVEGEELRGPLAFEDALPILEQLIDGIEAAHEKGIIHRDLKPANIKITPEGVIKILDFGLARAMEPAPSGDIKPEDSPTFTMGATQMGAILGTAAYMAPEQAKGNLADRRSDIWSFGVIVYEMLTGKRLFQGESAVEILGNVLNQEPDVSAVPVPARELLRWCLERDRKQRLASISDARRLLHSDTVGGQSAIHSGRLAGVRIGWLGWAAAVLLFVIAAAVSLLHFREQPPQERSLRFLIPLPEKTPDANQRISPDGRYLVFMEASGNTGGGSGPMWLRSLTSLTAQPLPGTERATYPFWSPDSKSIGFFADGKLKRIELAGGPALALAEAPIARGGTWAQSGSSGVILFAPIPGGPIQSISAAGGAVSAVTKRQPTEVSHRLPWFLPDGRHFVYSVTHGLNADRNTLHWADISSSEDRAIEEADSGGVYSQGFLLFMREDILMAQPFDPERGIAGGEAVPLEQQILRRGATAYADFSASTNGLLAFRTFTAPGNTQLTWEDRSGKELGLLGEPGNFGGFQVSPDGKSVVAMLANSAASGADLWILDATRGLRTRFTFDPGVSSDPVWSPDGRSIIFMSHRQQHGDIYRKSLDGTGAEELLYSDSREKQPTSWSPDGKFLLYQSFSAAGNFDVWVLPLLRDQPGAPLKPFPFMQSPAIEGTGQFSPDGKWIAYASNESGQFEIYAAHFPDGGSKRQISVAGGYTPRWRRDGKEMFYVAADGKLTAVAVTLKADTLDVGEVKPLFGPVEGSLVYRYDMSPDGQRILIVPRRQGSPAGVTIVQNWTGALKK